MKRIGILSDTHGIFDDALCGFFEGVDELWHAGDVGSPETADRIAAFKPLRAVYGNIDGAVLRRMYPKYDAFACEQVGVLMTHIGGYPRRYDAEALLRIREVRPKIFVTGHSHILRVMYDRANDLLYINPGAAGCYGCHQVRTAVRFTVDGAKIADMEVGQWQRG